MESKIRGDEDSTGRQISPRARQFSSFGRGPFKTPPTPWEVLDSQGLKGKTTFIWQAVSITYK